MPVLGFGSFRISEYGCIEAIAVISSISVFITSLEGFALAAHYSDGELFSWKLHRLRSRYAANKTLERLQSRFFDLPGVFLILGIRVAFCILAVTRSRSRLDLLLACVGITVTSMLLSYRGLDGKNGADQMTKITFVSLSLALFSSQPATWRIAFVFLAGQLALAYATAGVLKLQETSWRNGTALLVILRQITYGNAPLWRFAKRHPLLTRVASCGTIAFECGFIFALLLPFKLSLIVFGLGLLFHLANAAVVGLNTFLWAFIGIYPAFIWCTAWVQSHLYGFPGVLR
ncbi:MAG: hypothetical protein WA672_00210 [Candidatus Angelobacter sp.]